MTDVMELYREMGIRPSVYRFGEEIEAQLKERFEAIDKMAEYNQLKVIRAMQENRVNAECFNFVSGYGYDDYGRDTLEKVYASVFHTESALGPSTGDLRNSCACACAGSESQTGR